MARIISRETSLSERLGSDLKLPITGSFESITGVDLLLQDMQQLLLTIPGERPNRPNYGCLLRNQVWENIDDAAINGESSIRQALDDFEPRITVLGVSSEINRNTDLVTFSIQFVVNATDQTVNLVFPFRAGTQLSFA